MDLCPLPKRIDLRAGFFYSPAHMSRHIWLSLICCCAISTLARAADAPLDVSPQPGVVLLRNGQVVSGRVTQAGEFYYVSLPSGEIRLQSNQVELVCHSLAEGYERKRSRIDPDKLGDHLDLALWCICQHLHENADAEIAEARAIDPRHPRIALVERQLKLAQERPAHEPRAAAASGPSNEDLDRLLRGMPPGTVETFANSIQPLLLNTCATAGCHGAQSEGKLRLLRTQLGKSSSRRFTQRNLHAVVEMIDRADPPASPLLKAPVSPHGTAKAPIFTNKDMVQYRQLVQWVMRVAQNSAEQPANVEKPDDHLLQRLPQAGRAGATSSSPNYLLMDAAETADVADVTARTGARTSDKKSARATTVTSDATSDPFDAEVFNRQFLPSP